MPFELLSYGIFFSGFAWLIQRLFSAQRARKKLPLPPGPPGLPLVGNVNDLPPPGIAEWTHWIKHKDIYGPISSVTVLGQTIILLHSKEMASELLDKRSAKFSSRPHLHFASEMVGWKDSFSFSQYNESFKKQRRMAVRRIGSQNLAKNYFPSMEFQANRFLLRLMNDPDNLKHHIQFAAASLILDLLYGYETSSVGPDPLVHLVDRGMEEACATVIAGVWFVDFIPWLEYLPEWLPGMGFKDAARRYRKTYLQVNNIPYGFVEEQRAAGSTKTSYVSGLLDANPAPDEIKDIKFSASTLYGGGSDTTVALVKNFFLAMSLSPEVQRRAQEEIDTVIGKDRLPNLQDRPNLPYLEAVLTETLRWISVVPLGLVHTSDKEDEFQGYLIPKGSIIMPSIAWFGRDPANYPDPEIFNPERFLGPNKQIDPRTFTFGFGRRICPGRYLAEPTSFILMARSLASFKISKAIGSDGKEIDPVIEELPGVISHVKNFRCTIVPRSEKQRELLAEIECQNPSGKGDSEHIRGL
ncbi:hypothetical protein TWF788_009839 [Orbilia oligospora]|uniref:Cytochrome P450 n=2 Tax=Orbilia oligospora TaxID=2813651 RepID=A0A6G1M3P2_ORBOL|nr:hypothetical protein TWF788_009839 [Orbilia oligospora]KAF3197221.1 hypothetical protein TWF679_003466 [Orbilia oligospora]KAF3202183.1 hypothetical protein TWF191_003146 [Orbilia oligospora]KAF3244026.1 hypothetical protein TWF192_007831 [Orbilia oligospora]